MDRPAFSRFSPHAALMGIVIVLRLWACQGMWMPGTTMEELQTGGLASGLIDTGKLPLEFRFTNLTAATGFKIYGENLAGLRIGFIAVGLAALCVFIFALSCAAIPLWAIAVTGIPFAASPFLAALSLTADESCFGASVLVALLSLCLIVESRTPSRKISSELLYGAIAFLSAALFYEYAAFKPFALAAGLFVLMHLYRLYGVGFATHRSFLIFASIFMITVAPIILDIYIKGHESIFFDSVRRHHHERSSLFSGHALTHLPPMIGVLSGLEHGGSPLVPFGGSQMPPLFGMPGLTALLLSCFWHKFLIVRLSSITALTVSSAFVLLPNNYVPVKLAPVIVVMWFCLGASLALLLGRFDFSRKRTYQWGSAAIGFVLVLISVNEFASQLDGAAQETSRINHYSNDDYWMCMGVQDLASSGAGEVIFHSPRSTSSCDDRSDSRWLTRQVGTIRLTRGMPAEIEIKPRSVVIIGDRWKLSQHHLLELERAVPGPAPSQYFRNLRGDITTAARCYRCE